MCGIIVSWRYGTRAAEQQDNAGAKRLAAFFHAKNTTEGRAQTMGSNHYENRRSYPTKPPKYKSVEQVQELIDGYFADCDAKDKPYTITGLAYALYTTRKTLLDYQYKEQIHIDSKIADKISDAITRAKQRCEVYANEALYDKCKARGAERDLLVNYDWRTDDDGNKTQVRVVFEGATPDNDAK